MNDPTPRPLAGLRILVVGDVLVSLPRLPRRLLDEGASRVDLAQSVDAAVGSCVSGPIDIAVIPERIGRTHGVHLATALRTFVADLAVVFVQSEKRTESAPADVFLMAPVTTKDVVGAVRRVRGAAA